jgi:acyl-CoA synthetase (AMP-forming)/AMP-acid ligase II
MKALIFLTVMLYSCQTVNENCSEIKVRAFTHHFEEKLLIFINQKGDLLSEIEPDEEAGWIVEIVGVEGDYFKVNIDDLDLNNVWVLKKSLSLNTRNYDGQSIILYQDPTKKSGKVGLLDKEQTVMILDACKDWVYIKGENINGTEVSGWLEPDMQCGNPYTTCS